jgi:hypothetical protein
MFFMLRPRWIALDGSKVRVKVAAVEAVEGGGDRSDIKTDVYVYGRARFPESLQFRRSSKIEYDPKGSSRSACAFVSAFESGRCRC